MVTQPETGAEGGKVRLKAYWCGAEQRDDSRTDRKAFRELIDSAIKITQPDDPSG